MNKTEIFTALGDIKLVSEVKRFVPNSIAHFNTQLQHIKIGEKVACTFSHHKVTRSSEQLKYYMVLCGYIAQHSGDTDLNDPYSKVEVHDALCRAKFGTKTIKLGDIEQEVRRSVSDSAKMPKSDMVELVTFAKEVCKKLGIKVPTKAELGYVEEKDEVSAIEDMGKGVEYPENTLDKSEF